MSGLDDLERKWRQEDRDRLDLAAGCMGSLEAIAQEQSTPKREARLAEMVHDLRIAIRGDDVARAELHAHNQERTYQLFGRPAARKAGESE